MKVKSFVTMVVLIVLSGVLAGSAQADKLALQEKLSKDVSIELDDVTIAEALEKIGKKAGVKFVLSDEAQWKLPYGKATRLAIVMEGPLAEGMTEMLNAFFMRYAVGKEEVTIYPRPELGHIIGRPNTKQLELLKDLYTKPVEVYYLDEVQKTVNAALGQEILISPLEVIDQLDETLVKLAGGKMKRVKEEEVWFERIVMPGTKEGQAPKEYILPTPVTVVQLLRDIRIRKSRTTEWHIPAVDFPGQTPEIRVVEEGTLRTLRRKQLIDISYEERNIIEVLRDLTERAGVGLYIDPDLKFEGHKISVSVQNVTAEQALKRIADMSNLYYEYKDNRYMNILKRPEPRKPRKAAPKKAKVESGGYVGKISIPMDGGKYFIEFMLREGDLNDELKKLRAEKMKEVLGRKEDKTSE